MGLILAPLERVLVLLHMRVILLKTEGIRVSELRDFTILFPK